MCSATLHLSWILNSITQVGSQSNLSQRAWANCVSLSSHLLSGVDFWGRKCVKTTQIDFVPPLRPSNFAQFLSQNSTPLNISFAERPCYLTWLLMVVGELLRCWHCAVHCMNGYYGLILVAPPILILWIHTKDFFRPGRLGVRSDRCESC